MSDERPSAPGRRLLALGVVGFALAIVALVFMLWGAQSLQVSRLYLSDVEPGILVREPVTRWLLGVARAA